MRLAVTLVLGFLPLCFCQRGLVNHNAYQQIELSSYYEIKEDLSHKPTKEDLDGIVNFLSKFHGSTKSRNEILQHIQGLGTRLQSPIKDSKEVATEEEIWSCYTKYLKMMIDSANGVPYAVQTTDSWGSVESGWLVGNVRWPGHYYECIDVKHETDEDLNGKWCNSYWGFKDIPYPLGYPIDISFGLCMPNVCTKEAIEALLWISIAGNDTGARLPLQSVYCPEPRSAYQMSTATIVAIVISVFIGALLVVGTVCDLTIKKKTNRDSTYVKVALCFSVISNGEKILDMEKKPGSLPVIDGIRFLSTTWVIIYHSLLYMCYALDNAGYASRVFRKSWSLLPVSNGTFSVDTFYFLGGFLVAYLGIQSLHKTKGKINIPLLYLKRYIRLTPAYAYAILFSVGLYRYVGQGPFWQDMAEFHEETCRYDWWTNLLYITTIYPANQRCFGVAWYLSNDMMFYILSPFVLLVLYYAFYVGLAVMCFIIIGCQVAIGILASHSSIQPTVVGFMQGMTAWIRFYISDDPQESPLSVIFMYDVYFTPWSRYAIYLIGMLTGYLLYKKDGKLKMNKFVVAIGWTLSTAFAAAIIYGLFNHVQNVEPVSDEMTGFYHGASRPAWALCMAWVVVACSSGYGGPVTTFLNWKVFTPLSRLTYSTYLCHIMVLFYYIGSQEKPLHFLMLNMVYIHLGTVAISFGIGFLLTLAVEWPMIGLLKLAFPPKRVAPRPISNDLNMEQTNVQPPEEDFSGAVHDLNKVPVEGHNNVGYFHDNGAIVQPNKVPRSGPPSYHSEDTAEVTEKIHAF